MHSERDRQNMQEATYEGDKQWSRETVVEELMFRLFRSEIEETCVFHLSCL